MSENKKQSTSEKEISEKEIIDVKEDINVLENQAQKLAELINHEVEFNEWDNVQDRLQKSAGSISKESINRVEEKQLVELERVKQEEEIQEATNLKKIQENEKKIRKAKSDLLKKEEEIKKKWEKIEEDSNIYSKNIQELSNIDILQKEPIKESNLIELDAKDEINFFQNEPSIVRENNLEKNPVEIQKESKEKIIEKEESLSLNKDKEIFSKPKNDIKNKLNNDEPLSLNKNEFNDSKKNDIKNKNFSNNKTFKTNKDSKTKNSNSRSKHNKNQKQSFTGYNEKVVRVKKISKTTKGGRNMRFSALVIIGDKNGLVGYGIGKSIEVPVAIRKALKDAKNNMVKVKINKNGSLFHEVLGRKGAGKVLLKPAPEGTGIIAGGPIRVVLEMAGYKDAYSKNLGKNTSLNMVLATINGLLIQKTPREIANLRDKDIKNL